MFFSSAVPSPLESPDQVIYGASAHSDYGMITLLATDGVPGLQVWFIKIQFKSKCIVFTDNNSW